MIHLSMTYYDIMMTLCDNFDRPFFLLFSVHSSFKWKQKFNQFARRRKVKFYKHVQRRKKTCTINLPYMDEKGKKNNAWVKPKWIAIMCERVGKRNVTHNRVLLISLPFVIINNDNVACILVFILFRHFTH